MSQQVAQTILQQIGGNQFIAMTGAKDFVAQSDGMFFGLPVRFAKRGINKVKIVLTPDDLYTMTFYKFSSATLDLAEISEVSGLYADQLTGTFTDETGLDTHL